MKPIEFKGFDRVFAKEQKQYLPLPAVLIPTDQGEVVSCWQLNLWERLVLLITGKLWLSQWTFYQPLQPQRPSVKQPFVIITPPKDLQ